MAAPTGILAPMPRIGIPLTSGIQAFFYAPGTTTKQNTYTTSALSAANSNPLVADANGLFGAVYLDPALGYKIVIAPSTDTDPPASPIFTQDNFYLPAASYLFPQMSQFRLTLTSGTPVTTADVSAATTLYCSPYGGNRIDLYNSTKSAWERFTSAEFSITLVGLTASTPYDVFCYSNSGVPTLELTAWSSATARATALTTQDGVYVKTGATTRRYLGTIYINSTGGQSDDTAAKRYLWNYYHRDRRPLSRVESTSSWTYTTATVRQANGSTSNQVDVVVGLQEATIDLTLVAFALNTTAGVNVTAGIGEDSTTTYAAGAIYQSPSATNGIGALVTRLEKKPAIGRHVYSWNEYSAATGTTTWFSNVGAAGSTITAGLNGSIEG